VFTKTIEFEMYLRRRLIEDVKPEILKFVSDIKAQGYKASSGGKISTVHFDPYAPQF